jgi:hypothetical protein
LKYIEFLTTRLLRGRVFYWNGDFMKITGTSIKDCKRRGEWAELRFMARASEHGLGINKPWGDSSRYDFIVEHAGKFLRVQVKSTTQRRDNSYICNLHSKVYTNSQVDFIAVYIIPKNVWFIFPIDVIFKRTRYLTLSPHMKVSKNGPYQEAWHLLRGEPGVVARIEACSATYPHGALGVAM